MNNADKIKEWEHYYKFCIGHESKWQLFKHLKDEASVSSLAALKILVEKWLKE